MKGRAAPSRAMRVDHVPNLGGNTLAFKRVDHPGALPFAIERSGHVLCDATAAGSEPGTDRRRAVGRGVQRLDKVRALAFELDQRPLAGQGERNDRSIGGDALPMGVERDDRKLFKFSHGARR